MHISLGPSEIHIWQTDLSDPRHNYEASSKTLSIDERTRAGRFKFEDDQQRFVIARSVLRKLLAVYTGQTADAIQFEQNRYGKPNLSGSSGLHFNVSHSHDAAVYAIACYAVGIDIERIRPFDDAREIARNFFRASEADTLEALPAHQQIPAFFQAWARKEAYIKALGRGLSAGMDAIDVRMGAGCADWVSVSPDIQLRDVVIDDRSACAVAVATQVNTLCQFVYPG